jgi:hypothetical protein
MNDLARARLHEAGHALVGHAVGQESGGVTVLPGGDGYTRHWLPTNRQVAGMTRAEWRTFLEGMVVSYLAGEAALDEFGDPQPRRGAEADRARALETARTIDPSASEATRDRLYGRARVLAREHRVAIERFAETLRVALDRLAGEEVQVALDAALGGWPTPRFDPASKVDFMIRRRAVFEEQARDFANQSFTSRLALWKRAEAAVRSGQPLAQAAYQASCPKGATP